MRLERASAPRYTIPMLQPQLQAPEASSICVPTWVGLLLVVGAAGGAVVGGRYGHPAIGATLTTGLVLVGIGLKAGV